MDFPIDLETANLLLGAEGDSDHCLSLRVFQPGVRDDVGVEDGESLDASPYLDGLSSVEPIIRRVEESKFKLVSPIRGKLAPIIAIALIDVEDSIRDAIGFAKGYVRLSE